MAHSGPAHVRDYQLQKGTVRAGVHPATVRKALT